MFKRLAKRRGKSPKKKAEKKENRGKRRQTRRASPLLSGTSIFLLDTNTAIGDTESVQQTIEALGGRRVHKISEATHTLLIEGNSDAGGAKQSFNELPYRTLDNVSKSEGADVPVVGVSWLNKVLDSDCHWTDIDASRHLPRVLREFDDEDDRMEIDGEDTQMDDSSTQPKRRGRRDSTSNLSAALSEAYTFMTKENPGDMEEAALRRAIELSMLDWALVFRHPSSAETKASRNRIEKTAHQILGIKQDADPAQIKAAYRRKALETHPDKGGEPGEFESVARAYRTLLRSSHEPSQQEQMVIKSTAHWDNELRDHQTLVSELFQNHGTDLSSNVAKMEQALEKIGLFPKEAGASNINEKNERISNSCFYLSLASSYLHGIGALSTEEDGAVEATSDFMRDEHARSADEALIGETALDLKRTIEAAVVNAHPEWAEQGKVGEEVQAFSDFLVYVLDSPTILSDWAVAVFDTVSGFVDVYKGKSYPESDLGWARSNTITLRYVPGHYQPLLPHDAESRPDLGRLLLSLDSDDLFYVITDGAA